MISPNNVIWPKFDIFIILRKLKSEQQSLWVSILFLEPYSIINFFIPVAFDNTG